MPTSVTFTTSDTSKTFTFTANDDLHIDDGESVLLGFGTLPVRVNAGTPSKSTVNIADTYCTNHAILCATLDFREGTSPGAQRLYLNRIDNDVFTRNGVDCWLADINVTQNSGHAPVDDINIKWQHGYPERTRFDLRIHSPDMRANGHEGFFRQKSEWLDWTLHVITVSGGETVATELRLNEARLPLGSCCLMFFGRDIDDLRRTWQPGQNYDLRLVEDPRSNRTPQPLNPPMYLRINEEVARLVPGRPLAGEIHLSGMARAPGQGRPAAGGGQLQDPVEAVLRQLGHTRRRDGDHHGTPPPQVPILRPGRADPRS